MINKKEYNKNYYLKNKEKMLESVNNNYKDPEYSEYVKRRNKFKYYAKSGRFSVLENKYPDILLEFASLLTKFSIQ